MCLWIAVSWGVVSMILAGPEAIGEESLWGGTEMVG